MIMRTHLPKRLVSVLAALFLSAAGAGAATVASSTAANAAAGCTAAYSEPSVWNTGFTGTFNVTNSGTTAITGWTVTLTYAGNPTLQPGGWNGTWSQTGATVTVTNLSYNGALAPGAAATGIGSNFNYTGTHTPASSVTCTPAGGTTTNTVTVTSPGARSTVVGTAVSLQIAATDSGSGQTLTYSATGLPAGLAISSSGLISGTPTTAGSSSVTVTARDGTGASGSATFTWTVTVATGTVTVTNPGSRTGTVGTAATLQIQASDANSGQTLTFSATGLPAGLAISSSGLISGTPTTAGTSSVTVTARDGTGASGSATFSWTINAAATQSIKTTASSLSVAQSGTGTVGVSLAVAPSANVTVTTTRTSGNTGLSVSGGGTLTFTPANFATAQNVTFAADASSTGSATFTLSATGITSVTVTVTETTVTNSGAAQLHVSGSKLLDANGNTVVLHGINRSGTEYSCVQGNGIFDGEVDQAAVTAMKSWKVNSVRVPLNEACWNGESYVPAADAGTNYINGIKSWVSLLNSNGLDVILDLHWTDGDYTGNSAGNCSGHPTNEAFCQKPMPDAAQAIPFWTSVANTFKGNNSVLFDLFNEPFASRADNNNSAEGWQCWATGSPCTGISYPVAGMQQMVNAVRGTGATNVIMLGGEEFSNDLTSLLANLPTDSQHNLVASWHSYNFNTCSSQSCWTSQIQPVAAQIPVVTGEMGENDCAGTYINQLMPFLDSIGVSYLGWAWNADFNCSSGPSLITDYVPGTPTAFGAAYKAHLAAVQP
jgi:endoglucanase